MNAVAKLEPTEVGNQSAVVMTPMGMIEKALSSGATPETLEKLLTLQERWEANQARKAFIADMALARAKFKPIIKKNSGYSNRYKYETLSEISDSVDPALNEHGFSYDWRTEDLPDGRIRVTCIVTHEQGHSRENSLSGHPDDTADAKANMNGHQRMGGAVTYLQRYTLKAALGIAASADTDGATPRGESDANKIIGANEIAYFNQLCEEVKCSDVRILKHVGATNTSELTFDQYRKAISALKSLPPVEAKKEPANVG